MKAPTGLALLLLLATAHAAAAQPSQPMPPPHPAPPPPPAKSAGVGVGLGVAGTIVPLIGFGVGLSIDDRDVRSKVVIVSLLGGVVLPASGLLYARKKASIGYLPRVAAVVVLGGGALFDALDEDGEADKWYTVSAALYLVGAAVDIALTPSAVRDYNTRVGRITARLTPTAVPAGAGLALAGQF